jgi:hypothetical protein
MHSVHTQPYIGAVGKVLFVSSEGKFAVPRELSALVRGCEISCISASVTHISISLEIMQQSFSKTLTHVISLVRSFPKSSAELQYRALGAST